MLHIEGWQIVGVIGLIMAVLILAGVELRRLNAVRQRARQREYRERAAMLYRERYAQAARYGLNREQADRFEGLMRMHRIDVESMRRHQPEIEYLLYKLIGGHMQGGTTFETGAILALADYLVPAKLNETQVMDWMEEIKRDRPTV